MKPFAELYYQRPHAANLKRRLKRLIRRFETAKEQPQKRAALTEISDIFKEHEEMKRLAIFRSHQTGDSFYKQELLFYASMDEDIAKLESEFHDVFLTSDFQLNPDNPQEVATGQRAVFQHRIQGQYLDESLAYEAGFQKRNRLRIAEIRKALGGSRSRPESYEQLLTADTVARNRAWTILDEQLQKYHESAAIDYLNFVRLRTKMGEYAEYATPYDYASVRQRLRFDTKPEWDHFRGEFATNFLPLQETFRRLQVKKLGDQATRLQDVLLLVPAAIHQDMPLLSEHFMERMTLALDERLGEGHLFHDLFANGYIKSLEEFQLEFAKHPVSLPASGNAVLLVPEVEGRHLLNVIERLFAECGRGLLHFSTLKNYPGADPGDEAPGAEAMAALGLSLLFTRDDSPLRPEDEAISETYTLALLTDLLLARYLYLLPHFLLMADFESLIYKNPELEPDEVAEIWRAQRMLYYPELDFSELPGYAKGYDWILQLNLFESPFSSLEEPYAFATLLSEQPWRQRAHRLDSKLNRFLLANRNLRFDVRLETAGFKTPAAPDFFPTAVFSLMDRLEL